MAQASPNLNDQALLAADPTFIARVKQALVFECLTAAAEATSPTRVSPRSRFASQILNNLFNASVPYDKQFAVAVAVNASVILDATDAGATPLTLANVAAQAALVTDDHINIAVAASYDTFVPQ